MPTLPTRMENELRQPTGAQSNASLSITQPSKSYSHHSKTRLTTRNTTMNRNLFNIDFQKTHNNKGTHDQFNEAWAALTDAQKQVCQTQQAT
jgi:hypothetical protein